MSSTTQKLAEARERHRRAQGRADFLYRHTGVGTDDPGAVSGTRRRSTPRQVTRSASLTDRALDAATEVERTRRTVERLETRLRTEQAEAAADKTATVDIPALRPGDRIRHRTHGISRWDTVRRVNTKSITCEPRWEGHDPPRIPRDRIVETRHQGES